MSNANHPIGVFDSGIGGLTVAKGIKDLLPAEQVLYFGDTAHLPYGDKSKQSIRRYLTHIFEFLHARQCKMVVIACNSASSVYDSDSGKIPTFGIPVVDVIFPVVNQTVRQFSSGTIGVIGTKRTIQSGIYKRTINRLHPNLNVVELATPLLAPMIEERFANNKIARTLVDEYLHELGPVDALILGCTHYPLIKKEIDQYYNHRIPLIDAPQIIALEVQQYLKSNHLLRQGTNGEDQFYVSDFTSSFEETAQMFFGKEIRLSEKRLGE